MKFNYTCIAFPSQEHVFIDLCSFSHERFVILNLLMLKLGSNAFQYILGNENVNFIIKIYNRITTKL